MRLFLDTKAALKQISLLTMIREAEKTMILDAEKTELEVGNLPSRDTA